MRYRDQDYYLLGAALDGFLKSVRGPRSDLGEMLQAEGFTPIGIRQVPAIRHAGTGRARRRADTQSRTDGGFARGA
jgi:hypothetical protein